MKMSILNWPQYLFVIFRSYLIFTTNFVFAFHDGGPNKIQSGNSFKTPHHHSCTKKIFGYNIDRSYLNDGYNYKGYIVNILDSISNHKNGKIQNEYTFPARFLLENKYLFRSPKSLKKNEIYNNKDYYYEYEEYNEDISSTTLNTIAYKTTLERIIEWFLKFKPKSINKYSNNVINHEHESLNYNNNLSIKNVVNSTYSFQDVLHGLKQNESTGILIKKILSAASALSERSGNDPVFMLWTIPTTLFAFLGILYFLGATVILIYKYLLFANDSTNGQAVNLLPVVLSFIIPFGIATTLVTTRNIADGKIGLRKIIRGDLQETLRYDFDIVHFFLDAIFGTYTMLGIGWLISVAI